jgi:uncharacterized caspase-like protein
MRGFIAGLLAWLCVAGSALAEKRLALVIGNDAYQHIDALQKARADAKSYAALLREKGFSVEDRYDLGFIDMQGAIGEFVEKIAPGDTAVFVYSGHGWSDGAHNYLVGVDAPDRASQDVLTRLSLPIRNGLTGVLDDFERKGAALKVAIIDACRDNPFQPPPGQRSYGLARGLRPEGVEGSFVVYSAGEGQSAMDRLSEADADPNSVFTRAFLPLLRADLPLLDAIKTAQELVHEHARSAGHDQSPAYYDEVLGEACLSRECKEPSAAPPSGPRSASAAGRPKVVTYAIPESLMDEFGNDSVIINGNVFHVVETNRDRSTISLLGPADKLYPGMNWIQSTIRNMQFWRENDTLEEMHESYQSSYAVIFAIDKYDRPGDGRGPTPYAALQNMVAGAEKLKETLQGVGFPPENIETHYNEDATATNFEHSLQGFWTGGIHEKAGRLFIYFGGHGDKDERGLGFLVTYDFDPRKPRFTSFAMQEFVSRQFPSIDAHHVLVALDSCSAGLAIPGMHTMDEKTDAYWIGHFGSLVEVNQALQYDARDLLVAGTGDDQAIDEGGGIFTQALIRAIKGEADLMKDGVIEFDELTAYVKHIVRVRAQAMNKVQVPSAFNGEGFGRGTFLFPLPKRE